MKKGAWIAVVIVAAVIVAATQARSWYGWLELRQAKAALGKGDVPRAAELAERAARHAPSGENADYATLYRGYQLTIEKKDAEALRLLNSVRSRFGSDPMYRRVVIMTSANMAFDERDYDGLVRYTEAAEKELPSDRAAVTFVATAYSCKWAVTGDEAWRKKAEAQLAKAEKLPPSESADRMVRRIRHRFETRTILTDDEYDRMFQDADPE